MLSSLWTSLLLLCGATPNPWFFLFCLLSLNRVDATLTTQQQQQQQQQQHPVIAWLQSRPGGYFNSDKVEFRDGGLFATQDIAKGVLLLTIPLNALLGPGKDGGDICDTARRLVFEYSKMGESSEFAPYLKYVFESFPHDRIPTAWSFKAKKIIRDMVQDDLEPQYFGVGSYYDNCSQDDDNEDDEELLEAAWRIVISRGWRETIFPVYDMINHRNGLPWHNVDRYFTNPAEANLTIFGDYQVKAFKDISAGQQLHNSYNQCHDTTCDGAAMTFLTPEIFNERGFVEQHPRRFAFFTGSDGEDENLGLVIEIDRVTSTTDTNTSSEETVTFLTGPPNADQLQWLHQQLKRLSEYPVQEKTRSFLRPWEAEAILEYYQALVGALKLAVAVPPESSSSNEVTEFPAFKELDTDL